MSPSIDLSVCISLSLFAKGAIEDTVAHCLPIRGIQCKHRQQRTARDNFLSVSGELIQFGPVITVAIAVIIIIFCLIANVIVPFVIVLLFVMQSKLVTELATSTQLLLTKP